MANGPDDVDMRVAGRLAELRARHGITLAELAARTGMSVGHLSRLEKGSRLPSVSTLLTLARTYAVSVSELVDEHQPGAYHLLRADDAPVHDGADGRYRVMSGPKAAITVMEVQLRPGSRTKDVRHRGEEWLHVRAGAVQFTLEEEQLSLTTGDSIQFDSDRPHHIANDSAEEAVVLLVTVADDPVRSRPFAEIHAPS